MRAYHFAKEYFTVGALRTMAQLVCHAYDTQEQSRPIVASLFEQNNGNSPIPTPSI